MRQFCRRIGSPASVYNSGLVLQGSCNPRQFIGFRSVNLYMMRHLPFSFFGCLALLSAFAFPADAAAESLPGVWKRHHTFDHQLASLAPAPGKLYILMHPMEYRSGASDDVGTPSPGVFVLEEGGEKIYPLAEQTGADLGTVRLMRYNPLADYLLLCHNDGKINLFYADGHRRESTVLSHNLFPGGRTMHEATFAANGSAYIATDFGYVKIGSTAADDKTADLGGALLGLARLRNDFIAILPDGSIASAPTSVSSVGEFSPLQLDADSDPRLLNEDGSMLNPLNVLPLSDDAFASLVYLPEGSPLLSLVVRRGSGWHGLVLIQDGFRLIPSTSMLNSMADSNGLPNRDGYYFNARNIAYQVRRDADFSLPDDLLREQAMQIKYKLDDANRESATWDFRTFWFYNEREGLYGRVSESGFDSSTKWEQRGNVVTPDFPVAFISDEIVSHPSRGLLLQNHGISYRFTGMQTNIPSMLCGLKGAEWSNYSPAWHTPSCTADDKDLASRYSSQILSYPVSNPKGLELDPDNPDYVYTGSMQGGICRFNLADPSATILHMSHPGDRWADFPGFVKIVDTMNSWKVHCNFSTPRFDADGNLWSFYYNLDAQRAGEDGGEIKLWTRADRLASEGAENDPSRFRSWKTLKYHDLKASNYGMILPLKYGTNAGLLALTANSYAAPIIVIDTKGTTADENDDEIAKFTDLVDTDGAWVQKDKVFVMREDPASGMVWTGTDSGVFYFSPSSAFYQPGRVVRPRPYDSRKGTEAVLLEGVQVYDIAFDAEGRKWIATHGDGVVCVSADNSRIEGHWTTRDSALPSDIVYGIGCDVYGDAVLASTECGLAEFIPTGAGRSLPNAGVCITPARVRPDYVGWIEAVGLPAASAFDLRDSEGNVVRTLNSPGDGTLRWDGLDADGRRCSTGRYYITSSGASAAADSLAEIIFLGS